jgi:cobalt transporter subunit CbtB
MTAQEMTMTTLSVSAARSGTFVKIIAAMSLGLALVYASGFAQSQTLHDAAHDMRHSTGFPCH